jgi:MFS family permease
MTGQQSQSRSPAQAPPHHHRFSNRYRQANLALFCAGFITFVTLYAIQPLLPLFTREFSISPAISSLPLSISTATLAVGMLFSGLTSDSNRTQTDHGSSSNPDFVTGHSNRLYHTTCLRC